MESNNKDLQAIFELSNKEPKGSLETRISHVQKEVKNEDKPEIDKLNHKFDENKIDSKLEIHEQIIESNVNKLDSLNIEVRQIKDAVKEKS